MILLIGALLVGAGVPHAWFCYNLIARGADQVPPYAGRLFRILTLRRGADPEEIEQVRTTSLFLLPVFGITAVVGSFLLAVGVLGRG